MNVKRQVYLLYITLPTNLYSLFQNLMDVMKMRLCFFLNKILRVFVYFTGSTILSLYKDRVQIEKISPGGGCTNNAFNN